MPLSRRLRRSGTAIIQTTPTVERGLIVRIYPNNLACDVVTDSKKTLLGLPLPNLIQFPGDVGGHVEIPETGTYVVVQHGNGKPQILGYCQLASDSRSQIENPHSRAFANYSISAPTDLLPGEWMQYGDQAQHFAVKRSGVLNIFGSSWAQVTVIGPENQLNIVGRKINIFTAMGDLIFDNANGKQSFSARLGTDLSQETLDKRWRYWLDMNSSGYRFHVTSTDGEPVYTHEIDLNGNGNIFHTGQVTQRCMAFGATVATGANIETGQLTLNSQDSITLNATGVATMTSDSLSISGMNAVNIFSNNNVQIRSGRVLSFSATGPFPTYPTVRATEFRVTNGNFAVEVGIPGMADAAMSGIELITHNPNGEIKLDAMLGRAIINTTLPNSVILGGMFGLAHTVKWETGLQAFLEALLAWLDTHTHPGNGTPPTIPTTALRSLFVAIPSLRVMVGA